MSTRHRLSAVSLALSAACLPAVAAAQRSPTLPPVGQPYYQTIAVNAAGLPFGLFSAEYEASMGSGFTLGVGGSYLSSGGFGSVRGWAEGKALYYPNEVAFDGFGVGLTAGALRAADDTRGDTRATFGILANYDLLLGPSRRFLVGVGAGVRRVVGDIPDGSPMHRVYPDGRAVIGLAF